MRQITFSKGRLTVEIPDYYECLVDYNYSLILYPKNRLYNIKFLVVGSDEGDEQAAFYNNKKNNKNYLKKFSEEKYYNVYDHVFDIDADKLFVVSFEIVYRKYYINIRVNTLEKLETESRNNLIKYIDEIIKTINENH